MILNNVQGDIYHSGVFGVNTTEVSEIDLKVSKEKLKINVKKSDIDQEFSPWGSVNSFLDPQKSRGARGKNRVPSKIRDLLKQKCLEKNEKS